LILTKYGVLSQKEIMQEQPILAKNRVKIGGTIKGIVGPSRYVYRPPV
jgi:hypothetical protein